MKYDQLYLVKVDGKEVRSDGGLLWTVFGKDESDAAHKALAESVGGKGLITVHLVKRIEITDVLY